MVKVLRELTYYILDLFVICFYNITFALSLDQFRSLKGGKIDLKNTQALLLGLTQIKYECNQMLKNGKLWMYSI